MFDYDSLEKPEEPNREAKKFNLNRVFITNHGDDNIRYLLKVNSFVKRRNRIPRFYIGEVAIFKQIGRIDNRNNAINRPKIFCNITNMFSNSIRLILFFLVILLLILIFSRFPKLQIYEDLNPEFVVLNANQTYSCEADLIKGCTLVCYDLQTATRLVLKPQNCENLKSLKKGKIVTFKVLPLPYSQRGEIPVEILKIH